MTLCERQEKSPCLKRKTLREAKEKFILEGQKALIAINGAGGAALLAFLQAIWGKAEAEPLILGAIIGLMCFALGVGAGTISYPLRHLALTKGQMAWERGSTFDFAYRCVPIAGNMFLMCGLLATAIGGIEAIR